MRSRSCTSRRDAGRCDRRVPRVAAAERRFGADALQPRLRAVGARRAATRRWRSSRPRCGSIPTTPTRTTISAPCCSSSGRPDEAQAHFERAVALRPDNVEARANLGQLLSNRGELGARGGAVRRRGRAASRPRAGARRPRLDPRDGLRPGTPRGDEAVRLAERAAALTNHHDLAALDALGAAYAATGRYDEAVGVARQGRMSRPPPASAPSSRSSSSGSSCIKSANRSACLVLEVCARSNFS